jgi:hypothetical protein
VLQWASVIFTLILAKLIKKINRSSLLDVIINVQENERKDVDSFRDEFYSGKRGDLVPFTNIYCVFVSD